jgi:peptidoglycan/LPS O-acetylase OafA/YrhL
MPAVVSPESQGTNLIRPVMPELDSVRGVAILGVVFLHGFFWPYSGLHFSRAAQLFIRLTQPGWMGVNLFFVLSGFLITGILVDSRGRESYYKRFYMRRILRILPAYYAVLILLLILGKISLAYFGLSFVYLSNVTELLGVPQFYGPLWSLAVEEHYYLFWPAIVRRFSTRGLAVCAFGICALVPFVRAISFSLGFTRNLGSYTWCVADGLAVGSLLAMLLRTSITRKSVGRLCATLLGLTFMVATVGSPLGILTRNRLLGAAFQYSVINLGCSGALLLVLLLGTGSWKRFVNWSWLRFFGYISYGLYLIHLLIFSFYDTICAKVEPALLPASGHFSVVVLRFGLAGGLAVGVSYLSRKYFEEKFLKLKHRLESNSPRELVGMAA